MYIDRLVPAHAAQYRALMLEAYAAHPDAFTSSPAERAALALSWWEARVSEVQHPLEVLFGAFEQGHLMGVAGLSFESREKVRHKAHLFGMYVPVRFRGQGLGRQLVHAALACARSQPGVRLVQLTVTHQNAPAEALYRGCGFVPFGLEPEAVAVGPVYVSKVHMWCPLADTRSPPSRQASE